MYLRRVWASALALTLAVVEKQKSGQMKNVYKNQRNVYPPF
jgi:hypothetical protein